MVFTGGPKFDLVASNDLNDSAFDYHNAPSKGTHFPYSSAVISEGKIIIQGHNQLWCIGNRQKRWHAGLAAAGTLRLDSANRPAKVRQLHRRPSFKDR